MEQSFLVANQYTYRTVFHNQMNKKSKQKGFPFFSIYPITPKKYFTKYLMNEKLGNKRCHITL